jgi:hypothetical protein
MKKLLTALLTGVLMVQSFSFVALAADIATVTYDVDTLQVTVSAEGYAAGEQVSLVGFYAADAVEEISLLNDDVDYIDQLVADETGKVSKTYLSREEVFVVEDDITVFLNGEVASVEIEGEDDGGDGNYINSLEIVGAQGLVQMSKSQKRDFRVETDNLSAITWDYAPVGVVEIQDNGEGSFTVIPKKSGLTIVQVSGLQLDEETGEEVLIYRQFTVKVR